MKTRKNIQGIFAYNDVVEKLESAEITNITEYDNNINDINVFYTYEDTDYKISFTDGDVDLTPTTTTTTTAPITTTTTTIL